LETAAAKEKAHEREYDPTLEELEAYLFAALAYKDRARYGNPRGGGYLDQPAKWKIALDCIEDARQHADRDAMLFIEALEEMAD
jgi:hypothetical protein